MMMHERHSDKQTRIQTDPVPGPMMPLSMTMRQHPIDHYSANYKQSTHQQDPTPIAKSGEDRNRKGERPPILKKAGQLGGSFRVCERVCSKASGTKTSRVSPTEIHERRQSWKVSGRTQNSQQYTGRQGLKKELTELKFPIASEPR